MHDTLAPGLIATFRYEVPAHRTVPHLLPEAALDRFLDDLATHTPGTATPAT